MLAYVLMIFLLGGLVIVSWWANAFFFFLSFSLSLSLFACLWAVTHMIHILQYIGPQFLCAIRPSLGEQWTPDMEEAWTLLLGYMTATMKKSLLEARNAANSPKPVARPATGPHLQLRMMESSINCYKQKGTQLNRKCYYLFSKFRKDLLKRKIYWETNFMKNGQGTKEAAKHVRVKSCMLSCQWDFSMLSSYDGSFFSTYSSTARLCGFHYILWYIWMRFS